MQDEDLLTRIGGSATLESVVGVLYEKLREDADEQQMEDVDQWKTQQTTALALAISTGKPPFPESPKFVGHLVEAFQDMQLDEALIGKIVVPVISPSPSQSTVSKLGGEKVLNEAIQYFYTKVLEDESLSRFFNGVDMDRLKSHQSIFLQKILTNDPMPGAMHSKHHHLFEMGLNVTHYDTFVNHFFESLHHVNVEKGIVDEIVEKLAPFRDVFEIYTEHEC